MSDIVKLVPGDDWNLGVQTRDESGLIDISDWTVTYARLEHVAGGGFDVTADLSVANVCRITADKALSADIDRQRNSLLVVKAIAPGGEDRTIVWKRVKYVPILSDTEATTTLIGVQGPNGLSAFEIAQMNGFVGTEAEWLDSFRNRANHTGQQLASTISDFAAAAQASIRDYTISAGNPLNDAKPYAWSPKLAADGDATTGGVGGFWNLMKEGVSQSIMTKAGRLALAGMLALGSGDASLASVGLKASGNAVQARLADDSGFADFAARQATLTPATNNSALTIASYSLTGANAQAALTIGGALNTSGSPNVLSIDIAHTASGAATNMIRAAYGGSEVFSVSKAGDVFQGALQRFAGTSAAFPMLKRNGAALDLRLADDSGYGALTALGATLTGGTVTASTPLLSGTQNWNNAGVTFTGALWNYADTASAADSRFATFQIAGTDVVSILKGGGIRFGPNTSGIPQIGKYATATDYVGVFNNNATDFSNFIAQEVRTPTAFSMAQLASLRWASGPVNVATPTYDLTLFRGGAGILEQRNGTNAQTSRLYNIYNSAADYERASFGWASSFLRIETQAAGSGGGRGIVVDAAGNGLYLRVGASGWNITTSRHVVPEADNSYDLATSSARARTGYFATQVVVPELILANPASAKRAGISSPAAGNIQLENGGSFGMLLLGGTTVSFPAIKRNGAGIDLRLADDSAYAALAASSLTLSGRLILDNGTISLPSIRFSDDDSGIYASGSGQQINLVAQAEAVFSIEATTNGARMSSTRPFGWSSSGGANSNAADVVLWRGGAGILELRNGANAQTQRWYNTYTDGSNYGRGFVSWASNVMRLGVERAGTGPSHNLALARDGADYLYLGNSTSSFWTITSSAHLIPGVTNNADIGSGSIGVRNLFMASWIRMAVTTVASLPAAATAGAGAMMLVSDASAPTFGATVAGGGAVVTPVYSDGTNWKVG